MTQRTIPIVFSIALLLASCEPAGKQGGASQTPAESAKAPAAASTAPLPTPGASAAAAGATVKAGAASGTAPAPAVGLAPAAAATAAGATAKVGTAVKTASGLEYTVLKEGAGATPTLGSMVKVHVTGTLPGGKVFLDTRPSGVPKEYKLDSLEMIPGWREALLTMKIGEKRKLHVPSGLAYGVRGSPEVVPPRSDVDFELELVSFAPPGVK